MTKLKTEFPTNKKSRLSFSISSTETTTSSHLPLTKSPHVGTAFRPKTTRKIPFWHYASAMVRLNTFTKSAFLPG